MPNLRFQSTPPARGATKSMLPSWERQYHFNPRPPRGGRHDLNLDWLLKTVKISIHAPREGGDRCNHGGGWRDRDFNPRPPRGGRLIGSIVSRYRTNNFNPRPPRGGRLHRVSEMKAKIHFNPRPPRGGRLPIVVYPYGAADFNPRPPRGGRRHSFSNIRVCGNFNPRPPRGGRQQRCTVLPADL